MKPEQVRAIARRYQTETGNWSKSDLIRNIQGAEGNFDCYATACKGECDQADCVWRKDCFDDAPYSQVCM